MLRPLHKQVPDHGRPKDVARATEDHGRGSVSRPEPLLLVSRGVAGSLVAQGLEKSYGDKKVLRGVDFRVSRGEVLALLGPNGAGKTTSFYIVMGLVRPDRGVVTLDGTNITHLPVFQRARMGMNYLPQESSVFRGLSVEANILAVLELYYPERPRRMQRLDELLEMFRITPLRKDPAASLSGGERRRLEIARCMASDPNYILLDEPLAGIDPISVQDVARQIAVLRREGIGVLITDHNVRDALGVCDRAVITFDGTIIAEGSAQDILDNPEVREVYLGRDFLT